MSGETLFEVQQQWGMQPVQLTALRSAVLPEDIPITSVHIVALYGGRVLVVCDRRGLFGYPGGRLEPAESWEAALDRELYEEAAAHLNPGYHLFATMRIECLARIPGKVYAYPPVTCMGFYAGTVRSLEPIRRDPAGIVASRSLFTLEDCRRNMQTHDLILLREGLIALARNPQTRRQAARFLRCEDVELGSVLRAMREEHL